MESLERVRERIIESESLRAHLSRLDKKESFQQAYRAMAESAIVLHGDFGYSFCIHGQPLIICTVWSWKKIVYKGKTIHKPFIKHTETLPSERVFEYLLYHSRVTSLKKRMFPASEGFERLQETKLQGILYWLTQYDRYNSSQQPYKRLENSIAVERFLIKHGHDSVEEAIDSVQESLDGKCFVYRDNQ